MVARAPIVVAGTAGDESALEVSGPFTQSYIIDRSEVWGKLAAIFGSSECWTYAKVARRSRDGRLCYRSVFNAGHTQKLQGVAGTGDYASGPFTTIT